MEKFESQPQWEKREGEIVGALNSCEYRSPEALRLIGEFCDLLDRQREGEENADSSRDGINRAALMHELRLSSFYLKTREYKQDGVYTLLDVFDNQLPADFPGAEEIIQQMEKLIDENS